MQSILVIEDDGHLASILYRSLSQEGYEITLAPDGQIGWDMATQQAYDLIIMDIMLPEINGLELCKKLRATGYVHPILMLTALSTTQNLVSGLDCGADDYLVKPYKLAELLARVRSLLRRSEMPIPTIPQSKNVLSLADLELNLDLKTARRKDLEIDLTVTEFRLLQYFLKNKNKVLSRMEILEYVWGIDFNMNTKVVDVYVNYLRKKIDKPFEEKLIHTVIGMGYILKVQR